MLTVFAFTVFGCGSKVVVGRSIEDYRRLEEKPSVPEKAAKPEPAPAPKPEAKAEEAPEKPKPEAKAEEPKPEAKAEEPKPAPKLEVKVEEPPTAAKIEPVEKQEAAPVPQEPKPSVTPQSSRRETATEGGPAPYELDLSFGEFGLSQGLFDTPVSVAVDEDENIYILDQGNFRMQKFDRFGLFIHAWGRQGLGDGEYEVVDNAGVRDLRQTGIFEFNKPTYMLFDTDDMRNLIRITVVDSLNQRIQRFLLTRSDIDTFPDDVFVKLPDGGTLVPDTALKDRYDQERIPVILDPVYINSARADNVLLTPYVWGGLGFTQGLLNNPTCLVKDDSGILWVSDTGNGRLQGYYVTPENPNTDTTFFREIGNDINKDYGSGRLNEPTALVYDNTGAGSFLVLDTKKDGGFIIQRIDREGEFQGIFAESGGKPGQLRQPVAMAVNPFDNTVFITDRGHRKVMVYNNKGEFLFSFGGEELSDPRGIAVLRNNYVYVTDAAKNKLYRYIPR